MIQPIKIIRGTTKTLSINIVDEDGNFYRLRDSDVLRFGVKRHPGDSKYIIIKEQTGSVDDQNEYIFSINPEDTEAMSYGDYYYDVGVQTGNSYYNIIECSPFEVSYNITERRKDT